MLVASDPEWPIQYAWAPLLLLRKTDEAAR